MANAYLILENGVVFKGQAFGLDAEAVGELVFTTGMAGYLETLTDPCYSGQIVLQTFPLAGNYGVIPADFESGVHLKAYIVREWCQQPSNFRSEGELDTFLRDNKIPGLCDIDTRALTRIIRENGVMNAMISKTPELTEPQWAELRSYRTADAAAGCRKSESGFAASMGVIGSEAPQPKHNIAIWNFGAPQSFITNSLLHSRAGTIHSGRTADELLASSPDGIILSEGPGDPAENAEIIEEIKKLLDKKIPILGAGLGHQMLAIANGAKTEKLRFGHRGANQPVRDVKTGQVFVTAQNHGYTVVPDSLPQSVEMTFINCNDGTCEGLYYHNIPALSVEFRPDGPSVFRSFAALMERSSSHAAE